MITYDVTDCRARIIRPGENLVAYCTKNKPFACINASLYSPDKTPTGTLIENGKQTHSAGNGFGVGIPSDSDGKLTFGKPWDRKWDEYLTGYNSPVQNGAYVDPGFEDKYVFNGYLTRIGLGQKDGRMYIVCDDGVTLKQFAQRAIAQGFDTLVNLDGGASRHVWYDRRARYNSYRVPYNAIVFLDDSDAALDWARREGFVTDEADRKIATALYRYHKKYNPTK